MALFLMENGAWKGCKKVCVRGQSGIILDCAAISATTSPGQAE